MRLTLSARTGAEDQARATLDPHHSLRYSRYSRYSCNPRASSLARRRPRLLEHQHALELAGRRIRPTPPTSLRPHGGEINCGPDEAEFNGCNGCSGLKDVTHSCWRDQRRSGCSGIQWV